MSERGLPRFIVLSLTCGAMLVCLSAATFTVMAGMTKWRKIDQVGTLASKEELK